MNKYDLIRRLRKECGVTEEEMKKFVKAMLDTFTEALTEGDRVFPPRTRDTHPADRVPGGFGVIRRPAAPALSRRAQRSSSQRRSGSRMR